MDLTQTQTQVLKVSDLRPNAGELECIGVHANPRQISETDYAKLLTSMKAKNMTGVLPLKVFNHEGTWYVLGGNMRLRAMQELGIEQVSCIVVPADTDAETLNEIIIKDNATFGEWDMDALANWDEPIADWCVNVPSVSDAKDESESAHEDDFDEEKDPIERRVVLGDVWQLGNHRLMCGSSTDPEAMERLMDGHKADIAFTSPPYNIMATGFDKVLKSGQVNVTYDLREGTYNEFSDDLSDEDYGKLLQNALGLALKHADDALYNIGILASSKIGIVDMMAAFKDKFCDIIIWNKNNCIPLGLPSNSGMVSHICELIFCFNQNGSRSFAHPQWKKGVWNGQQMINRIDSKNQMNNEYSKIHHATFPVEFASQVLSMYSEKSVLDQFGGTGTTMIAAEQLDRKCYMMEIDPHYCDVIIARWEKLTGQKAVKNDK